MIAACAAVAGFVEVDQPRASPAHRADIWGQFATPSKNIRCVVERNPQPPIDWGITCQVVSDRFQLFMTASNPVRRLSFTRALDPPRQTIAYGTTRRLGPFRCSSQVVGLRCWNSSGRGWFLARGKHTVK